MVDRLQVSTSSKGEEFLLVQSAGCILSVWNLETHEFVSSVQLFRPRLGAGVLASAVTVVRTYYCLSFISEHQGLATRLITHQPVICVPLYVCFRRVMSAASLHTPGRARPWSTVFTYRGSWTTRGAVPSAAAFRRKERLQAHLYRALPRIACSLSLQSGRATAALRLQPLPSCRTHPSCSLG